MLVTRPVCSLECGQRINKKSLYFIAGRVNYFLLNKLQERLEVCIYRIYIISAG
jgi:hypothetical protein